MACGLPVVATDVGGCREVIGDAGGGVVVPVDSIQGFVDATAKWLGSPVDYDRASCAARKRAEEFSIERIVARMEDLYDEVVRQ
jgi:glycosyltransferase involved in cell wall biosynthesis